MESDSNSSLIEICPLHHYFTEKGQRIKPLTENTVDYALVFKISLSDGTLFTFLYYTLNNTNATSYLHNRRNSSIYTFATWLWGGFCYSLYCVL